MRINRQEISPNGVQIIYDGRDGDKSGARRWYNNSVEGRMLLTAQCPSELVKEIQEVWGPAPLVEEDEIPEAIYVGPTLEEISEENRQLKAQVKAQSESNRFLEDCVAEMAGVVYG